MIRIFRFLILNCFHFLFLCLLSLVFCCLMHVESFYSILSFICFLVFSFCYTCLILYIRMPSVATQTTSGVITPSTFDFSRWSAGSGSMSLRSISTLSPRSLTITRSSRSRSNMVSTPRSLTKVNTPRSQNKVNTPRSLNKVITPGSLKKVDIPKSPLIDLVQSESWKEGDAQSGRPSTEQINSLRSSRATSPLVLPPIIVVTDEKWVQSSTANVVWSGSQNMFNMIQTDFIQCWFTNQLLW